MKIFPMLAAAVCAVVLSLGGMAQTAPPSPYFSVSCVKVKPGKQSEFRKWAADTLHKYGQARVDSGALTGWSLLRAVQPQGSANECDYIATGYYPGIPSKPLGPGELDALLQKAGVGMTAEQYAESRNAVGEIVTSGIWQQVAGTGTPTQKGDYLVINYNKTKDAEKWIAAEKKIWMPFAEELTKEGITRGWVVDLRVVPDGDAMKYDGVTVDVYPSWEGYFNFTTNPKLGEIWKKVHPDMTFQAAFEEYPKVTTQVMRELWVMEDIITAAK